MRVRLLVHVGAHDAGETVDLPDDEAALLIAARGADPAEPVKRGPGRPPKNK